MNKPRTGRFPVMILAGAAVLMAVAGGVADAREHYSRGEGYVVAESRWGNGTVSGPVRYGRNGREVRLPGGTWVECARSCSETLRRQTVDFWQSMGSQAKDSGPGYLSWGWGRRY